jgi:hypothetical protein
VRGFLVSFADSRRDLFGQQASTILQSKSNAPARHRGVLLLLEFYGSSNPEDKPVLPATQFALSNGRWRLTYPQTGNLDVSPWGDMISA